MELERITGWNPFGITLESADEEYCTDANRLVIYAFRHRIEWRLPQLIQPLRVRHAAGWDAATVARLGRDWWEEVYPRGYGFRVSEGFLQVFLGAQTHSSDTTQGWSCFLPWTQWRFVRHSWYGPTGDHIETLWETSSKEVREAQREWRYKFEKTLVKARFKFLDFDGEEIEAATHIEEREWRFGEGWFKWLSLFRRPMVRRSLDIEFSKGTGPRKRSWKGGTLGHSIAMLPDELPEAAFRRYCAEHDMTFLGAKVDA